MKQNGFNQASSSWEMKPEELEQNKWTAKVNSISKLLVNMARVLVNYEAELVSLRFDSTKRDEGCSGKIAST
jgi:hypothetical protein